MHNLYFKTKAKIGGTLSNGVAANMPKQLSNDKQELPDLTEHNTMIHIT